MDERTQGIILRTRLLTETSLIVHWLTRDFGRLATVAKGARRPKSPFRGKLDLFYEVDFSFARSRKSDLHTLREVSLGKTHPGLRRDLGRLQQAAYAAALVEKTTEADTPIPGIFKLVQAFLERVETTAPVESMSVVALELKLLRELGLAPNLNSAALSPGSRKVAAHLADAEWANANTLKLSVGQRRELRQFLHGFLIFHLGGLPKGRMAALHAAEPETT